MKKEDKEQIVAELSEKFTENKNFYLADISTLTVNDTNRLRQEAHKKGVSIRVVKNTLIRKALENANIDIEGIDELLKGPSSVMFSENMTAPAKLIKTYREKNTIPALKAAFVEESLYVGDDKLEDLIKLKSKDELIADVIFLLKSPMMKVVSGLQGSGGQKIAGLVKTLSERES